MSNLGPPMPQRTLMTSPKLLGFEMSYDKTTTVLSVVVEIDIPTDERFIKVNMQMGENVHSARFIGGAMEALGMIYRTIEQYVHTQKESNQ